MYCRIDTQESVGDLWPLLLPLYTMMLTIQCSHKHSHIQTCPGPLHVQQVTSTCQCNTSFSPGGVARRAHLLDGIASIMLFYSLSIMSLCQLFLTSPTYSASLSISSSCYTPKGHNVVLSHNIWLVKTQVYSVVALDICNHQRSVPYHNKNREHFAFEPLFDSNMKWAISYTTIYIRRWHCTGIFSIRTTFQSPVEPCLNTFALQQLKMPRKVW